MKSRLPYLSAFALAAVTTLAVAQHATTDAERSAATRPYTSQPTQAPPQAANSEGVLPIGGRLLLEAINHLERRDSITARLRHQLTFDGNQMYGVGSYWQQGRSDDLQVRLELQIAGGEASLLEASNGWDLWVDRRLPTGRTVTRIKLRLLRSELQAGSSPERPAGEEPEMGGELESQSAPAAASPRQASDLFLVSALGGLPGLLASLVENFDFMPPQAMRLSVTPPLAAQPTEVAVYAVVGHWKPQRLAALVETDQVESVPARFPQEVLLLVGQADLFPYRVEYRRLETPPVRADNASAAIYQLSASPMVVLELSDVKFNAPIAAGQFDYTPPSAVWSDQTNATLERLRTRRRQQLAERVRAAATR